ncbi:MAG: HAMP domain-containing protein, partial [Oxalobacter sp.]|nr:HAMP domain-containing protein [Oxalobacter sp.]
MGRLFWKFFFSIWLAQLTSIFAVGAAFWLHQQHLANVMREIDSSPPALFEIESAAATLEYGGIEALQKLLQSRSNKNRPALVYAIDEKGQELLGRPMENTLVTLVRKNKDANITRHVKAPDGQSLILFVLAPEGMLNRLPPPQNGAGMPPRPPRPPPLLPWQAILAALLASLLFAALLAWYFSKPINLLRKAFKAASLGNLQPELGKQMGKRKDELADLGQDFDNMAAQLQALINGQRRLMHDVSHELRSPLARLNVAIGLARQQPEKQESSFERIEYEGTRINRLVDELLVLSRLEAGVIDVKEDWINVDELLAHVVNDARFEVQAREKNILFDSHSDARLKGNEELLFRAVENVVRNAIKHTPVGSKVWITCEKDVAQAQVRICVSDEGAGVDENELDTIFRRFFRSTRTY